MEQRKQTNIFAIIAAVFFAVSAGWAIENIYTWIKYLMYSLGTSAQNGISGVLGNLITGVGSNLINLGFCILLIIFCLRLGNADSKPLKIFAALLYSVSLLTGIIYQIRVAVKNLLNQGGLNFGGVNGCVNAAAILVSWAAMILFIIYLLGGRRVKTAAIVMYGIQIVVKAVTLVVNQLAYREMLALGKMTSMSGIMTPLSFILAVVSAAAFILFIIGREKYLKAEEIKNIPAGQENTID